MRQIDVLIVGGGQAGLAMSRCLADEGIEHVVLERGRIAERWRSERWDSLRLLTPNWQARLPGWSYAGPDPDGFMSSAELVRYLEQYAHSFSAPVEYGVSVTSVTAVTRGFQVTTTQGTWLARRVVVASGECGHAHVPRIARGLSEDIFQIVPTRYRNPSQLPDGGVLVVGASATGIQLASEIHASGRPVTVAVGRHTRLPRQYRGRDILWWLDRMGLLTERAEDVWSLEVARQQPSLQLVGTPEGHTVDVGLLHAQGVRFVGRSIGAMGHRMAFDDDLVENTVAADMKLARLRLRIDTHIASDDDLADVQEAQPLRTTPLLDSPETLDLRAEGVRTVLWATGYRRSYPWLKVPVLDERGEIRHRRGVTCTPGLYALGLRFQTRRNSNFIDGVGADARELTEHILAMRRRTALAS